MACGCRYSSAIIKIEGVFGSPINNRITNNQQQTDKRQEEREIFIFIVCNFFGHRLSFCLPCRLHII